MHFTFCQATILKTATIWVDVDIHTFNHTIPYFISTIGCIHVYTCINATETQKKHAAPKICFWLFYGLCRSKQLFNSAHGWLKGMKTKPPMMAYSSNQFTNGQHMRNSEFWGGSLNGLFFLSSYYVHLFNLTKCLVIMNAVLILHQDLSILQFDPLNEISAVSGKQS